ncbi:hypothetical protein NQ318_006888 [Aromia moschata]|uniref:Peroxidase n=1 Tax=Aromia moschata TaxID=1265417 RepID=A0AAV8YLJ2_9CUCU|nr:hypothetical protein NQ318_006888 [Aromia moschata]
MSSDTSSNNFTSSENENETSLDSFFFFLANNWPLSDSHCEKRTINNTRDWEDSINYGKKYLKERDDIEKLIPSLPIRSPSYRHQKVVATSERARNLSRFGRALPPDYADGVSQPRLGKNGESLPSARTVSLIVHRPYYKDDSKFSVMLAVWGQFLDHDITATALSQKSNGSSISCYPRDPFLEYNVTCLEFTRSAPAPTCCLGPREQLNQVTAFIDGSVIYGAEDELVNKLRDFKNGTLKMYVTEDKRSLLPVSDDLNDGCNREQKQRKGEYCFFTGDARANENLHLTSMHLLWARQHNLLALNLSKLNPHWDDETIFQETRRMVAAQMQHITYNEFLPILLGDKLMNKFNMSPQKAGHFTKYNDSINPNIANNFATAAFRFAHSIIPGIMKLLANDTSSLEYIEMHKMLFDPFSDSYFTNEVKTHLFEITPEQVKQPKLHGLDLVSLNIQRGRDHGLPGYNLWRKHCGLKIAKDFDDLKQDVDIEPLDNIKEIYETVDDVDLYTGALSEKPMRDSILGPTLTCLILDQFFRLKHGDRFWYENPQAFTLEQLSEIKKTSLASIICDNSDELDMIQPKPANAQQYAIPIPASAGYSYAVYHAWQQTFEV